MQALIDVILPVFLVIGAGYLAVWKFGMPDSSIDGLMTFTQGFAIPCLLFRAIWTLDLGAGFDLALLASFYSGSTICFITGLFGARLLFKRGWEDSVAIGFCCLFANSVLLGLSITERAYGSDALTSNFAIVALHTPFCYGLGITAMEIARARGSGWHHLPGKVLSAMFRNMLILAIALGMAFNLLGIGLPGPAEDALTMVAHTALPAALFAVGGVLRRYQPEGDFRVIAMVCATSLLLHPIVTWTMGTALDLGTDAFRSAVVTAAMAPGINGYVFANMYGRAKRVAASSVLIATALSILTVWVWLQVLP